MRARRLIAVLVLLALTAVPTDAPAASVPTSARGALLAPTVILSPAERASFAPLGPSPTAIPVLAYHQINASGAPYAVSQREFARQMAMLVVAGVHPISLAQFTRFVRGQLVTLPAHPVLITFDDGWLDAYRGADAVLASRHFQATMFVITAKADAASAPAPHSRYLAWSELRAMRASGRWQVALHAGSRHVRIPTGPHSASGPFYANLHWNATTKRLEHFYEFKRRVVGDLGAAQARLAAQVPSAAHYAFAVPYSDAGAPRSNWPAIGPWLSAWLLSHFAVAFTQNAPRADHPGDRLAARHALGPHTDTQALYTWLAATH